QSMQLAAGIVDEGSYWIELVKKLRERIADWARVVGEERLWYRRHAASAVIRRGMCRCCARKWRIWLRRRACFDRRRLLAIARGRPFIHAGGCHCGAVSRRLPSDVRRSLALEGSLSQS